MGLLALLCFALAVILMGVAVYLKEVAPLTGLAWIAFFVAVALSAGFHL